MIAESLISLSSSVESAAWKEMVNGTVAALSGNHGFEAHAFRDYLQQRLFVAYLLASCELTTLA
jgi:hypothetical protein